MTKQNDTAPDPYSMDDYVEGPDVDFSSVPESKTGVILTPGTYNAVVDNVEKKRGPKGLYYNWTFRITDAPYEDVKVWRVTSLAEKAADATFKTLQVILGDKIPRGKFTLETYIDRFLGRPVRLKISTRDYEGNPQNDVERILGANTGAQATTAGSANQLF